MKRALFVALIAVIALSGCSKDDGGGGSKHAGNLIVRCASLASSDVGSCDPQAAASRLPMEVITDGPDLLPTDDQLASIMVENTGETVLTSVTVMGVDTHCLLTNGSAAWSWNVKQVGPVPAGETLDMGSNYGSCFAGDLGPRQFWALLVDSAEVGTLLQTSSIADDLSFNGGYAPDDPAIAPHVLDFARIDFTLVAE